MPESTRPRLRGTHRSRAALGLTLLLSACSPRTELIVGITTDLVGGADPLTSVQLKVSREGRAIREATWQLGPGTAQSLPGSVAIFTDDGSEPQVVVELTGTLQSGASVSRDATVDLDHESTLFMRMMLARSCLGKDCGALTCIEGTCQPLLRDRSQLPAYVAGQELGLECDSGSAPIDTLSGQPVGYLPGPGPRPCADQSTCVENTCYRRATCSKDKGPVTLVNLGSDLKNCGGCGIECPAPPFATASCNNGVCSYSCAAGRADCDGVPSNGCEVDTVGDSRNCGGCGKVCEATNAVMACSKGQCAIATCAAGFGDCDAQLANGCEAPIAQDRSNCGKCGAVCAPNNGDADCVMGRCTVTACALGFDDCDKLPGNGCEASLLDDKLHCGGCGTSCSLPNATAACSAGGCVVMSCNAGFADCDKAPGNGCEVDLATNPDHCGKCGDACSSTNIANVTCAAGSCTGKCNAGFDDCNNNKRTDGCEASLSTDRSNCGKCAMACPMGQVCSNSTCGVSCAMGQTICNGNCVDTASSLGNCGGCGIPCRAGNAVSSCTMGKCNLIVSCNAGFADCNLNPSDGCEKNLMTDTGNCGSCGTVCSSNGIQVPLCVVGKCLGGCNAGTSDCDGNRQSNGCEVNTATDVKSCGGCGANFTCSNNNVSMLSCANGKCGGNCAMGFADCNSNRLKDGCEVNLNNDPDNCGQCGSKCSTNNMATRACVNGTCTGKCNADFVDCNGKLREDGCEINLRTSPDNCGGCGIACSPLGMATRTCTGGLCSGTCAVGFGDCNGNKYVDGCETPLGTPKNCGSCDDNCTKRLIYVCTNGTCGK